MQNNDQIIERIADNFGEVDGALLTLMAGSKPSDHWTCVVREQVVPLVLYSLEYALEKSVERSRVLEGRGLFEVGNLPFGLLYYSTCSGAVLLWDSYGSKLGADETELERVADSAGSFIQTVSSRPSEPVDPILLTLLHRSTGEAVRKHLATREVDFKGNGDLTLADVAAHRGDIDVLRICIESGANTSPLLMRAARSRQFEAVRFLVAEFGLDPQRPLRHAQFLDEDVVAVLRSLRAQSHR